LTALLEKGQPLTKLGTDKPLESDGTPMRLSVLPATVPVAIELASGHNDLPATLRSLADLYERQAEVRVNGIPAVLTPIMVMVVAMTIGFVILALMLPLIGMLDGLARMF
jgi:type IV pilus assembly protein PilC